MKLFAELIAGLEATNKTSGKIEAILHYLDRAPEADRLWFIALFTGKRPKRNLNSNLMKEWALEILGLPYWLFVECHSAVGDLGETLALILPPPENSIDQTLTEWITQIIDLKNKTEEEKKAYVLWAWNGLGITERLIFNKLIGGSFRLGVSDKMLVNALAKYTGLEPTALMSNIIGKWEVSEVTFEQLLSSRENGADKSQPYPFCLAYPLEKELAEMGEPQDWLVEYKWDGIRGQIIRREGNIFIWSRGEELVTAQFPELEEAVAGMTGDFVIDGEILAIRGGEVLNFNELQKRLNRKTITKKMQEEIPISFYAYDLLEENGEDLRERPMQERRALLEKILAENADADRLHLSPKIEFQQWEELDAIREGARDINSEGLMMKQGGSIYHAGRKKGDWWKWKISPLTFDAVLIYAQKGSGRRSSYYTDYTFAVRDGEQLVTIAKAYSGLTDKEIMEVSRFVTKNSLEKFGPVRTVKAELVFEIAFEGIGFSNRHKSGVAVRFPRILRWRRDKTVNDIDELSEIKKLIK